MKSFAIVICPKIQIQCHTHYIELFHISFTFNRIILCLIEIIYICFPTYSYRTVLKILIPRNILKRNTFRWDIGKKLRKIKYELHKLITPLLCLLNGWIFFTVEERPQKPKFEYLKFYLSGSILLTERMMV